MENSGHYNEFTFCLQDYREEMRCAEDYEIEAKLFSDMQEFIRIALNNGYQLRIWFDGLTYVVEYNYKDESLSGVSLEWIGDDYENERKNWGTGEYEDGEATVSE